MTTTSMRSTAPSRVNRQGKRHRDELDGRNAGQGVIKGIAFGGPLGGLLGLVVLTLAIPALGPGALLAGIIADAHPTRTSKVPQPLQCCSAD